MDLNHVFLFLAVVSPLLVLARAWRPDESYRGWRIAALVVLTITGLAWMFWRPVAGYIGGGAWFLLLFLPAIGSRKMTELVVRGDYKSARKLGAVLQILHPTEVPTVIWSRLEQCPVGVPLDVSSGMFARSCRTACLRFEGFNKDSK